MILTDDSDRSRCRTSAAVLRKTPPSLKIDSRDTVLPGAESSRVLPWQKIFYTALIETPLEDASGRITCPGTAPRGTIHVAEAEHLLLDPALIRD